MLLYNININILVDRLKTRNTHHHAYIYNILYLKEFYYYYYIIFLLMEWGRTSIEFLCVEYDWHIMLFKK